MRQSLNALLRFTRSSTLRTGAAAGRPAKAKGLEGELAKALERTPVASVGPIVSDELKAFGFKTDIAPDNEAFFLRQRPLPLVGPFRGGSSGRRAA